MEYRLLDHDECSSADYAPAKQIADGDTVILVFKGLESYQVTEARAARVVASDDDGFSGELLEPGMMIPVEAGQRIRFELKHAFEPPPFGDETLHVPVQK